MKKLKSIILTVLAFVLVLSSALPAFADEYGYNFGANNYEAEPYYPFNITAYDIEMNVLENNTLQITEKINVHFNEERHGIYRVIPTKSSVTRADGSASTIRAKVKNVEVVNYSTHNSFTTEQSGGNYTIKIGSESIYLIGDESYTISYDYVMGEDVNSGFDELYYNLIGNQWDTTIENVTFKITMPKEFDESKLGFSTGGYGTVGTYDINYTVDGNTITGSVTAPLGSYQALTVRLELPEEYFYFNKGLYYAKLAVMPIASVLALIAVFILWRKFGRDKKIIEVVEFYPPNGMSSADVAFWSKGSVTNDDLIPLLIELANEGFIEIEEVEPRTRLSKAFGKTQMKITLLQSSYTGSDKAKQKFFNGLKECASGNVVYDTDLEDVFYLTLASISDIYNNPKSVVRVFGGKSTAMIFVGLLLSAASIGVNAFIVSETFTSPIRNIIFAVSLAISACAFVLSFFIRQRTDEGHENLQKIRGFKLFLETAEKEKLETLVNDDPKYFYDILPYAYVLGVSDAWIEKFKNIAFEPASWYRGSNMMSYMAYRHFMNNTFANTKQNMLSAPKSSGGSGGGFSGGGGGFSGGGAGGGGGGSW